MKEYTLTYTVEITDILHPDDRVTEDDIMNLDHRMLANLIRNMLHVDHVNVSDLKVFITGKN